VELQGGSMRRV
ncbi:hypothetical protein A2U01_0098698, partial [Trifolium medium]|nr:hypothetical protein [Trifolium medium]